MFDGADHAREANELADDALRSTSEGAGVVDSVVDKMRGIAQSSDRIAEITTVIDGIAFQTNILALNAAAASSLHDQTRQLKEAVSVFEISPAVLGDARFAAAAHAAVSEPMLAY